VHLSPGKVLEQSVMSTEIPRAGTAQLPSKGDVVAVLCVLASMEMIIKLLLVVLFTVVVAVVAS